jgi:hypothetical protein
MAETFKYVKGDTGPQLRVVLTNETDSTPKNLTGGSVTLHFRAAGEDTALFSRALTIESSTAANGVAVVEWQTNDLNQEAGAYEGELEVLLSSGLRETVFDKIKFKIRDDFA